jgi:pyrroline-5-carboxylate reductase
MKRIIGFIGSGNMGGAAIAGIIRAELVTSDRVIASDISRAALSALKKKYDIRVTTDNLEVAKEADILFLSIKPQLYPRVIEQIRDTVKENVIIVTFAAGLSLKRIASWFGRDIKIVRSMPNTPAIVNEGMAAICPNDQVTEEELSDVCSIFNSFGKSEVVPENLMDVVTGVSGSSPAYIYMLIEAMADAAVAGGMPRTQAYKFAAQAVLGAAKMVLETGRHPGELKDMVCTPGGTTIDAVIELEKRGWRQAVMSAMQVCTDKSKEMSQK